METGIRVDSTFKLQVVVYAMTAVSVNVAYRQRINAEDGVPGEFNIASGRISTDSAPNYFYFQFAGNNSNTAELINAVVSLETANIQRGQCFVRVGLTIGGVDGSAVTPFRVLFAGYITSNSAMAFPGNDVEDSLSGAGYLQEVVVTDPAAGANFQWLAPTNVLSKLRYVYYGLETSAAVANRRPRLVAETTLPVLIGVSESTLAASSGAPVVFTFGVNGQNNISSTGKRIAPLIENVYVDGATFTGISSEVENLDAGDTITGIGIIIESWIKA